MSFDSFIDSTGHLATPILQLEEAEWHEGEPDVADAAFTPFECALFLPLGQEQDTPRGRRVIKRPTLLASPVDLLNDDIVLEADGFLDITATELTGADPVRWQVDGAAQPFGRPGDEPIGFQTYLKRVED